MRRVSWVICVLLVGTVLSGTEVHADSPADTAAAFEWDFAAHINQSRYDAGLPPLGVLPVLREVARGQSARMAQQNRLYHNPNLQSDITTAAPDWQRAGENVGRGYDVEGLHQAFMNSPAHRANVLGQYNYVGLGVVFAGDVTWVTEVFLQAPPGKVIDTRVPLTRIGAASVTDMAVAVSNFGFPEHQSDAVVVGRGDVFADVLAGGPLAAVNKGPVLLADHDGVSDRVVAEAKRVLKATGVVYLLGGAEALPPTIDLAFVQAGLRVERIAGVDRYGTAAEIAVRVNPNPDEVVLVSGSSFADAVVVSAPAASKRAPVLLTSRDELAGATRAYLAGVPSAQRVVVGGAQVIADAVATEAGATERVAGVDRYDTSGRVAQRWYPDADHLSVATGGRFQDALIGGPFAARSGAPVLLLSPGTPAAVYRYVHDRVDQLDGSVVLGTDSEVPADPLTFLFT